MLVCWWLGAAAMLHAQQPNVHYWHHSALPPGAIGSRQLQRGGPLPGFFQPVEIKVPAGAQVSLTVDSQFDQPQPNSRKAGMLIAAVYRMRVTHIRLAEGAEVFPTVEVVDRLYTPVGQEVRFPIPIDITEEDLKLAIAGKFVTRVIYVEDPRHALPAREVGKSQNWFEAAPGQDPLAVADGLGRPVAILRLGGRLPDQGPDPFFFYGSPPFLAIPTEQAAVAKEPAPPKKPNATAQPRRAGASGRSIQPAPERIPLPPHDEQPMTPDAEQLPPPAQPGSAQNQPVGQTQSQPVGQTFLSARLVAFSLADRNVCPTLPTNTGLAREGLRQS